MHRPRHETRIGYDAWVRCDHDQTEVGAHSECVRLATVEAADDDTPTPGIRVPWQLLQGGLLVARCVGHCDDEQVWYLPPSGAAEQVRGHAAAPTSDELTFSPAPADPLGLLSSLSRGTRGLGWAVFEKGDARIVAVLDPADGTRRAQWTIDGALAAVGTDAGAVAATETDWWRQAANGRWHRFEVAAEPHRVLAMAASGTRAFALLSDDGALPPQLAVIDSERVDVFEIPGLENPLHLVAEPASLGGVWVSEIEAPPPARTLFERFDVRPEGLVRTRSAIARDFDGRGAWWSSDGHLRATRSGGSGAVQRSRVTLARTGTVELPGFDSGRMQTTWHRVFIDVCLPPGTSVRVSAKGADETLASPRAPDAPANVSPPPPAIADAPPLGSRSRTDVDGWIEQPSPAREPYLTDQPLGLPQARPSLDDLPRGTDRGAPRDLVTLEVLLDADPGRYLWLRLHLTGTGRSSPSVHAVRVTHSRPSLLDHLPAWWRGDLDRARAMDRVLSLFEGDYTERQALITAMPRLFDARSTPSEALDWLSSFLAIERDAGLDEEQRRQLLIDMPELYRRRGTVWAMERMAHIVTGAPARVVEHFRLRGRRAAVVDGSRRLGASVLGKTLHLGVVEPEGPGAFESAIVAARPDLEARIDEACPIRLPPLPTSTPEARWARATAHQFTIVVFRPCDEATRTLLERAIEAAKPAHTLHRLCWADSGMRLDVNARIGLGTQLVEPPPTADTVGETVLSPLTHLAGPRPSGTVVGRARVGRSTHDGPTKEQP